MRHPLKVRGGRLFGRRGRGRFLRDARDCVAPVLSQIVVLFSHSWLLDPGGPADLPRGAGHRALFWSDPSDFARSHLHLDDRGASGYRFLLYHWKSVCDGSRSRGSDLLGRAAVYW